MIVPQAVRDGIESLDRARFEKIKEAEFKPAYDVPGLKYLRDKARNERDLRELYRGRALYELLQNADDAQAKKAVFVLSSDGLAFAHDGRWFTVANFRSLADGWSDKDPNQCIGHKGLGFRSVLDMTPAPHLVKIDRQQFFAVKFSWALNNGHIQEAFRAKPELRSHYDAWTEQGQLACPVMGIPGLARKHSLGTGSIVLDMLTAGRYGAQLTTMFWFPARDPDIDRKALHELGPVPVIADARGRQILLAFLDGEVSVLLPFLASVEQVSVYEDERRLGLARISKGSSEKERETTVYVEVDGQSRVESFFQVPFTFEIPNAIVSLDDTPKAVKAMKKRGARIVLSARLKDGQPVQDGKSCFHVYFPTEESTGLGFVVHGDFYVKPDRTRLMDSPYNDWLFDRAAGVAANEFLSRLLERYHASSVYASLSSITSPTASGENTFVSRFSRALKERPEPFIPTHIGLLSQQEVVLTPTIDKAGFWDSHFSDVLDVVLQDKNAFLAYEEDCRETRAFLQLAQVEVLKPEALLMFVEAAGQQKRSSDWWYECYATIAGDDKLSRYDHSFFAGRRLLPTTDSSVLPVPDRDSSLVICLPPLGDMSTLRVPRCFSSVFAFLDPELARLLAQGKDTVQSWIRDRFRIVRFEATELLPRAIRGVVPELYLGMTFPRKSG